MSCRSPDLESWAKWTLVPIATFFKQTGTFSLCVGLPTTSARCLDWLVVAVYAQVTGNVGLNCDPLSEARLHHLLLDRRPGHKHWLQHVPRMDQIPDRHHYDPQFPWDVADRGPASGPSGTVSTECISTRNSTACSHMSS
jgi:hypothetical protein